MGIDEIRRNAPSGATDYIKSNHSDGVEYFKLIGCEIFVFDDRWHSLNEGQYHFILNRIKPLY